MSRGGWLLKFAALSAGAVVVISGSSLLGPTHISLSEVLAFEPVDEAGTLNVFWSLRVPRTLLGAAAGAGLALAGVLLQTLFRNPLATPYTLGIASGSSLAAATCFLLGWRGTVLGVPVLQWMALAGALAALVMVGSVARGRGQSDLLRLLLAGVCVAYTSSAGVLLVTFLADQAVTSDIVIWLMGSLAILRPAAAGEVGVVLAVVLAAALVWHRALDQLALGEELAAARGVPVGLLVWGIFGATGLLVAVIVANCGPIGFVGLMVPHMARAVVGNRALPLICTAAVLGAAFLAVCDGIGRAVSRAELPVGIVTNMLGAVFFFYLLARRKSGLAAV